MGREAELATLHGWYATARQGTRQVGFITGEAGAGKTALVEAFVAQVAAEGAVWIGHGQCIEQYGTGEAYLPVLEALGRLCRGPEGAHFLAWLRQHAPSWLAQMPALLPVAERDAVLRLAGDTTQARMLRELAEALESLTAEQPLVPGAGRPALERRRHPGVAGVRGPAPGSGPPPGAGHLSPGGGAGGGPPGRCPGPGAAGAARRGPHSRSARCPPPRWHGMWRGASARGRSSAQLAPVLYQRTQGHALFLVTMVADLQQRGVVRPGPDGWELAAPLDPTTVGVPETLRHLIEQQFERLAPAAQTVVAAASVAGGEFAGGGRGRRRGRPARGGRHAVCHAGAPRAVPARPGHRDLAGRHGDGPLWLRACPVSGSGV